MMKCLYILLFIFPTLSFASVFDQRPQEISDFETLFNNLILAKRATLPPGFVERSRLVETKYYKRIYTVENNKCSSELFLGELFRSEVQNGIQELVVYSCEKGEDGVNFFRMGPNLKPFDSTSLLHLDFQSLIAQGALELSEGEGFFLEIKSFNLEFLFKKNNHYQKSLTLLKETPKEKVKLILTKSTYESEVWWEFDIYKTEKKSDNEEVKEEQDEVGEPLEVHTRFLTVSKENPFHEGVYSHARYFNGLELDPIDYLGYFDQVSKLIEQMGKGEANIAFTLPQLNSEK